MKYPPPGRFKSVEAFRTRLQEIDPRFDCVSELRGGGGPLGERITTRCGLELNNRFAVHPMEGWDGTRDGLPTEYTLRRWRRFGQSGAGMLWGGEAFAVQADGRANPNQLFLNPKADVQAGLAALRDTARAGHAEQGLDPDALVIGLQLTHSGRFSRPDGPSAPRRAVANPVLDAKFSVDPALPVLSDGELDGIVENFIRSAKLAQEIGFDFVDIKSCHSYLLNELLGARERPGPYGGDFNGRTRLFREIVAGIRGGCPGLRIGVRISAGDIYPHAPAEETRIGGPWKLDENLPYSMGFGMNMESPTEIDLEETYELLALFDSLDISLVNVSLGSPYYCPHVLRPATYPPSDGYLPPEDPLVSVFRHLDTVRQLKEVFPDFTLAGSGYTYLQEWLAHVAEYETGAGHVDVVGVGRMMLSYPEFPLHILQGKPFEHKRLCRTFSDCTTGPRNGTLSGCFPLDPAYRKMPEYETIKAIKAKLAR